MLDHMAARLLAEIPEALALLDGQLQTRHLGKFTADATKDLVQFVVSDIRVHVGLRSLFEQRLVRRT
jgi:hypothetical protein